MNTVSICIRVIPIMLLLCVMDNNYPTCQNLVLEAGDAVEHVFTCTGEVFPSLQHKLFEQGFREVEHATTGRMGKAVDMTLNRLAAMITE